MGHICVWLHCGMPIANQNPGTWAFAFPSNPVNIGDHTSKQQQNRIMLIITNSDGKHVFTIFYFLN